MPHLLIVDLPAGIDTDLVQAARDRGDTFIFLTADLAFYRGDAAAWSALAHAECLLEVPRFDPATVDARVLAEHARHPIDAVLCVQHVRVRDAARLARRLGTRFLDPEAARRAIDKPAAREALARRGIPQPAYALAADAGGIGDAVRRVGLPAILKPADGFGSQDIVALRDEACLEHQLPYLERALRTRRDYGLGAARSGRWLVERWMEGDVVGCDTCSSAGRHRLLGVHEKVFFGPPSFAVRGGCFTPARPAHAVLQAYVFAVLDAVGFDWGAAHVEVMMTPEGPRLIEINPRLVGAGIPRLVGLALGRSMHRDLIALHLGEGLPPADAAAGVAVTRWITAARAGVLSRLELPPRRDARIRAVDVHAQPGDPVRPATRNGDRLACVMACAPSRALAEAAADDYVANSRVILAEAA